MPEDFVQQLLEVSQQEQGTALGVEEGKLAQFWETSFSSQAAAATGKVPALTCKLAALFHVAIMMIKSATAYEKGSQPGTKFGMPDVEPCIREGASLAGIEMAISGFRVLSSVTNTKGGKILASTPEDAKADQMRRQLKAEEEAHRQAEGARALKHYEESLPKGVSATPKTAAVLKNAAAEAADEAAAFDKIKNKPWAKAVGLKLAAQWGDVLNKLETVGGLFVVKSGKRGARVLQLKNEKGELTIKQQSVHDQNPDSAKRASAAKKTTVIKSDTKSEPASPGPSTPRPSAAARALRSPSHKQRTPHRDDDGEMHFGETRPDFRDNQGNKADVIETLTTDDESEHAATPEAGGADDSFMPIEDDDF